jgi:flagella basal body P-ring formation protein FlgA
MDGETQRMNRGRKLLSLTVIALVTAAGANFGTAASDDAGLSLPPPPQMQPPPIDLTLLAELRAARATMPYTQAEPTFKTSPALPEILDDVRSQGDDRRLLETMLLDQLREAVPGGEACVLEQVTLPPYLELPTHGWQARFQFRLPSSGIGRASYTATLRDRITGEQERFSGTVAIDREATGVTVTRLVRRGETITGNDVEALTTRLTRLPRGSLDAVDLAVDTKARKELRPGEWLTEQSITMPDLVRRGQPVTMRLQRGALTILAPGVVQQRGSRGEVVRVLNAQSNKEIHAMILNKDEVQVIY